MQSKVMIMLKRYPIKRPTNIGQGVHFFARVAFCLLCLQETGGLQASLPPVAEIAAEIARQDTAWEDLEVRYRCRTSSFTEKAAWEEQTNLLMTWILTQQGWQRVRRESRTASGGTWVEEASFDGEFYMSGDSQSVGSGAFGHQRERFLYNSNVPRMFGLTVTGDELSQPVSAAEFLLSKESNVVLEESDGGNLIVAKGADPMAVGVTLELTLDPKIGFRPRKLVIADKRGLLSVYTDLEYQQYTGAQGKFWFPIHGVWNGFSPDKRAEVSRMTYQASEVLVDTRPARDKFILTYPAGALILNTDTGDSFYLTADSNTADVPGFVGKRMSLPDHDRIQEESAKSVVRQKVSSRRLFPLVAINLLVVVVVGAILAGRKYKNQS